jgi:hypothetical protein
MVKVTQILLAIFSPTNIVNFKQQWDLQNPAQERDSKAQIRTHVQVM